MARAGCREDPIRGPEPKLVRAVTIVADLIASAGDPTNPLAPHVVERAVAELKADDELLVMTVGAMAKYLVAAFDVGGAVTGHSRAQVIDAMRRSVGA